MSRFFAVIGDTLYTKDNSKNPVCPDGMIEMQPHPDDEENARRPFIAQADGTWAIPEPTPEDLVNHFTSIVQTRLDAFPKTRKYDDMLSLCTYATSKNSKFATEGQYGVEVRDETWAKCYEIMNAVLAGEREVPTDEELLAELPPLAWPDEA